MKNILIIIVVFLLVVLVSLLPVIIPSESYNEAVKQFGNRLF